MVVDKLKARFGDSPSDLGGVDLQRRLVVDGKDVAWKGEVQVGCEALYEVVERR